MKTMNTLTALALVLGLGSTAALAEDAQSTDAQSTSATSASQSGSFDWSTSADSSMDSRIDAAEAADAGKRHFGAFDANGDGYIARDEYLTSVGSSLDARLKARTEHMAGAQGAGAVRDETVFSEIDTDGDTKLSRDEYMGYAQQSYTTAAGSEGKVAADAYSGAMKQSYDPMSADLNADASISDWEAAADVEFDFGIRDADADDFLSQEEWSSKLDQPYDAARSEGRFATLDADKDDRLSPEEFSSWQTQRSAVSRSTEHADAAGTDATGSAEDTANTVDSAAPASGEEQEGWTPWTFRRYHF